MIPMVCLLESVFPIQPISLGYNSYLLFQHSPIAVTLRYTWHPQVCTVFIPSTTTENLYAVTHLTSFTAIETNH